MAVHNYSSGPNNSSAYMSSGRPWITGSSPLAASGDAAHGQGMHQFSHGWNDGASSSFVAGAFRTDGDAESGVTPAEIYIKFPAVTKAFEVIQSGSGIVRVHFRSVYDVCGDSGAGPVRESDVYLGNHYIQLDGDEESMKFNVKAKEVYISGIKDSDGNYPGFQLLAELTGIPTGSMYQMTGSGITQRGSGHG